MRYFIVMYQTEQATGNSTVKTIRNRYVNRDRFITVIKESNPDSHVIITNIIELSRKDFNNYNS